MAEHGTQRPITWYPRRLLEMALFSWVDHDQTRKNYATIFYSLAFPSFDIALQNFNLKAISECLNKVIIALDRAVITEVMKGECLKSG